MMYEVCDQRRKRPVTRCVAMGRIYRRDWGNILDSFATYRILEAKTTSVLL